MPQFSIWQFHPLPCSPFSVLMEPMFLDSIHFEKILQSIKRFITLGQVFLLICEKLKLSGMEVSWQCFLLFNQVRLDKNYRSTRCIVEAASFLIRNNLRRCKSKDVLTDNSSGSKVNRFSKKLSVFLFMVINSNSLDHIIRYLSRNVTMKMRSVHLLLTKYWKLPLMFHLLSAPTTISLFSTGGRLNLLFCF